MATPRRRLQVFISSTYTDLKEERQAAVEAVLAAGHIPAGMELFAAGSKSQLKTIEKWIDDSDVYMLILGHRYGSIEPESKKSYTHVEYDYAVGKGKPFFAMVATDEWRKAKQKTVEDANSIIETENGPALRAFREAVLSRICAMINDKRDIESAILKSLNNLGHEHQFVGWVRGDALDQEAKLLQELAAAKRELAAAETRLQKAEKAAKVADGPDWQSLYEHLQHTKLEVSSLFTENERPIFESILEQFSQLDISLALMYWKNRLITGITITNSALSSDRIIYNFVIPELLLHDIVEYDKAYPTIMGRRFYLSQKGKEFLIWLEAHMRSEQQAALDKFFSE